MTSRIEHHLIGLSSKVWLGLFILIGLANVFFLYPSIVFGLATVFTLLIVGLFYCVRPHWAIITFIILLPFHSFIITILISQLNIPLSIARLIAAWKELLLVGTAASLILIVLFHKRSVRLLFIDLVIVGWVVVLLVYFLVGLILRPNVGLVVHIYGLRDWMLYPLPFIIGRLVRMNEARISWLVWLIAYVGFATSLIGLIEYFFIPTEWHVYLGVPKYFGDFLNLQYPDYIFGLPYNYWTGISGQSVRRVVSVYLSGQGFAIPFLLIWPVVLTLHFMRPRLHTRFFIIICGLGLLLSLTRMTIVVCGIQTILILWIFRRYTVLFNTISVACLLLMLGLVMSDNVRTTVSNTIFLRDSSAMTRPQQWKDGVTLLFQNPLGFGLGHSGQAGERFGQGGGGSEAGYFKITGDLGLIGLMLFFSYFGGIIAISIALFNKTKARSPKALAIIVLITAIGFMLNNLTAPPDQSTFVMYVYGALCGIIVTYWQKKTADSKDLAVNNADLRPS